MICFEKMEVNLVSKVCRRFSDLEYQRIAFQLSTNISNPFTTCNNTMNFSRETHEPCSALSPASEQGTLALSATKGPEISINKVLFHIPCTNPWIISSVHVHNA